MDATTKLTGALPALIIIAALFTLIASWVLLRRYRIATIKGMSKTAGFEAATNEKKSHIKELAPLRFKTLTETDGKKKPLSTRLKKLKATLRTSRTVYLLAGLFYALIFITVYLITTGGEFIIGRFVWLATCFAWPVVIAILLIKPKGNGIFQNPLYVYLTVFLTVLIATLFRNEHLNFFELAFFWLWVNGPPTLLMSVFLRKKVRAVGPLVLAFMVLSLMGAFAMLEVLDTNDFILRQVASLGVQIGFGALLVLLLALTSGFMLFGFIGWFVLKRIRRRYQKKRFSDQMLTVDALFLVFGIVQSVSLAFEGVFWVLTGPLAFLGYKLVSKIGLKMLARQVENIELVPKLLYLRVFALGRRSEQFFGQFTRWWRNLGGISLISGPDLINSAIEPHEFLDFVGGRLGRQYVSDREDLTNRLTNLDYDPDPDGRYRVNDFFCRADNWKQTMQQLSKQSDVVLMDLRSFSSANMGCVFELEQLLDLISLGKIIFLVDKTTDHIFLKETLKELWSKIDTASPNSSSDSPTINFFQLQQSKRAPRLLIEELLVKAAT